MSMFNYIIEIRPVENNSGLTDISDIGMFGGVIRWASGYDSFETPLTCSNKFLKENWMGTLAKSVAVSRVGNYASIGGGTINVVSTTRLFERLESYDISIYNATLTILETRDGGANYNPIRTGVVSQKIDNITGGKIPFSDLSKSTATTITKEIGTSGKFYPVNFGLLPHAKTVPVPESAQVQELITGELKAVWGTSSAGDDRVLLVNPYKSGVTADNVVDYVASINESISKGSVAVRQGDNFMPLSRLEMYADTAFYAYFADTNTKDGSGIVYGGGFDGFCTIEPFGITSYNDFFHGDLVGRDIYNYNEDESKFVKMPHVRPQEEISFEAVSITDGDSKGWEKIPWNCTGSRGSGESSPASWTTLPISGANSHITNGWESQYLAVTSPSALYRQFSLFTTMNVPSTTAPDGDVVLAVKCGGAANVISSQALSIRWWATVVDKFGFEYPIGEYQSPIFGVGVPKDGTEHNYVDNCCFAYTDSDESTKWYFGQEKNPNPPTSQSAGVEMNIDLSGLPDMVWETGFEIDLTWNTYQPQNLFAIYDSNFKLYEIQLMRQAPFKADKVYTDVSGRKDQDDTIIESLPDVYTHALKLQNYTNRGIESHVDGWGVGYPDVVDWSPIYNSSDFSGLSDSPVAFQIMSNTDARTDKIKSEICRLLWLIGYTDKNGIERVKPMVDGLYNVDGVLITYGDLFKGKLPVSTDRKYSDVFTDMVFKYEYNTATEKSNKSVVVDVSVESSYGDMARVLYKSYKMTNKAASTMGDCKWLSGSGDNLHNYIENFYMWQGVYQDGSGVVQAKQRYSTEIKLPYQFAVDNDLDIASSILLQIPNKTYFGSVEANHSGIITAISWDIVTETPTVDITVEMLGGSLAGSDREIWYETGTAPEIAVDGGLSPERVIEGYYGSN